MRYRMAVVMTAGMLVLVIARVNAGMIVTVTGIRVGRAELPGEVVQLPLTARELDVEEVQGSNGPPRRHRPAFLGSSSSR